MRQAHLPRWCRRSLDIDNDSTEQYFLNFSFSCQTEVPAHPRLRLSGTISSYLHTNLRTRSGVQDLGGLSVSTECSSVSIPYTPREKFGFGFGFGVLFPPYLTFIPESPNVVHTVLGSAILQASCSLRTCALT